MHMVSLRDLIKMEFSLHQIMAIFQYWKEGTVFNTLNSPKLSHSLLYFAGCDGIYQFPDGTAWTATQGDVVYIPAGARYKTIFVNKQDNLSTILINFQMSGPEGPFALADSVQILGKDNNKTFNRLFYHIARESATVRCSTAGIKADLYSILDKLQKYSEEEKVDSAFARIAKGIAYLENDSDQLLSIDEIADMCGVSGNHFRRKLREYAGVSPVEFRLNHRLLRAKHLLESENFTVSEVSDMLCFSDVSYFSRIFKKKIGVSPSEYLKNSKKATP